MSASTFTEYLHLAIRGADGKWITNIVECEVAYLHDTAENGRPARTQILSVKAERADDVIELLPLLSESQVADLKRTAAACEGAFA